MKISQNFVAFSEYMNFKRGTPADIYSFLRYLVRKILGILNINNFFIIAFQLHVLENRIVSSLYDVSELEMKNEVCTIYVHT